MLMMFLHKTTLKKCYKYNFVAKRTTGCEKYLPRLVNSKLYHTNIIAHYENPKNVGRLDNKSLSVGTGLVGAPACGDVMKLDIMVNDEGIIIDSKFKTFGCGSAIASSSLMTEWVINKHINDAYLITNKELAYELKLPPVKLHCSILAEDAIKSAINDYLKKNQKESK
jgi:Fe-S cluster assembly scaffold IscU